MKGILKNRSNIIYNKFKQLSKAYFLFLTGTPFVKSYEEIVLMFQIVKPHITSESPAEDIRDLVIHVPLNNIQNLISKDLEVVPIELTPTEYFQYREDYEQDLQQEQDSYTKSLKACITNSKLQRMFIDAEEIPGKSCLYFRFVDKGLHAMQEFLKNQGYTQVTPSNISSAVLPAKRFIVISGSENSKVKRVLLKFYNQLSNINGELVKYIILSPAGSVGISLGAVRFLGICTAEYNYADIRQIIGRCNRYNSHISLPENSRTIINRIYLAEYHSGTIEQELYTRSLIKEHEHYPYRSMLQQFSTIE
jgi:hypothetical protein